VMSGLSLTRQSKKSLCAASLPTLPPRGRRAAAPPTVHELDRATGARPKIRRRPTPRAASFRVRPETYSVFSKPCVRVSGRKDGRRDAGASQGRLDAPGREHKAPVGHPSNSLKTRYMSPDGLSTKPMIRSQRSKEKGLPMGPPPTTVNHDLPPRGKPLFDS
jgi:hypothetical protein